MYHVENIYLNCKLMRIRTHRPKKLELRLDQLDYGGIIPKYSGTNSRFGNRAKTTKYRHHAWQTILRKTNRAHKTLKNQSNSNIQPVKSYQILVGKYFSKGLVTSNQMETY